MFVKLLEDWAGTEATFREMYREDIPEAWVSVTNWRQTEKVEEAEVMAGKIGKGGDSGVYKPGW